jgi:two-component system sensor histidine kinase/response regulator
MAELPDGSLTGVSVLLVEDDEISQMIAEAILSDGGITVTIAGNGQQALDALGTGRFDAVLMDCEMPVLDGFKATAAVRGNPLFDELPVIAMSAHTAEADVARCREAGMNDHVAKPLEADELFAALRRCLNR